MSRPIKVSDEVYRDLDQLRVGRQTFSDMIKDLLMGRSKILEAMNMLEGILKFREWQKEQLEKLAAGQKEG